LSSALAQPISDALVGGIDNALGSVLTQALVSSAISEATGGKFANGAAYAAFSKVVKGASSELVQHKDVPFEGEEAQIGEYTEKEKQLNALLADPSQENLDAAVAIASEIYGIDVSKTRRFLYQKNIGSKAAVASARCMWVYVSDFAFTSAGEFASTLSHEVFHINRYFYGRTRHGIAKRWSREWFINEVEAYNHEITNQWRFGTSDEYVRGLTEDRNGHQIDADRAEKQF